MLGGCVFSLLVISIFSFPTAAAVMGLFSRSGSDDQTGFLKTGLPERYNVSADMGSSRLFRENCLLPHPHFFLFGLWRRSHSLGQEIGFRGCRAACSGPALLKPADSMGSERLASVQLPRVG